MSPGDGAGAGTHRSIAVEAPAPPDGVAGSDALGRERSVARLRGRFPPGVGRGRRRRWRMGSSSSASPELASLSVSSPAAALRSPAADDDLSRGAGAECGMEARCATSCGGGSSAL